MAQTLRQQVREVSKESRIVIQKKFDIAIIGAGVLGLSHAYAALQKGLNVAVFERTHTPLGASVRNFGQALIIGQAPGEMLQLAKRSRTLWADLSGKAGFSLKRQGSLIFARTEAEENLLHSFCAGRAKEYDYQASLLDKAALADLYQGQFAHHRAALHGHEDQQVYSREAIPTFANYLAEHGVRFYFSTLVRDIDTAAGTLTTTQGQFAAEQILLCSGHDYQTLLAEEISTLEPQTCRLQMLRVTPKQPLDIQHSLLTGLSCIHYNAFADLPEAEAIRQEVAANHPKLLEYGIHLLASPTPYGDLIIGDSHDYLPDPSPFNSEEVDQLMIDLAEETLNCKVEIKERWQGIYGARGKEPISVLEHGKVSVVLMRTGLGMSVGPALGERTIQRIYG